MIQTDIRDLIQKHGLAFPEDVVDEKIWKQSQLVTAALIRALIQDYYKHKKSQSVSIENLGWRNKHKIYLLSEDMLSQRTVYNKCGVIKMNQSVLYEPCDFTNICKINSERDYVLLPIASFIPSKHFINPSSVEKSDAISNLSHRSAFSASKKLIKLFSSLLIFKSIVAEIITFIEMF